MERSRIRRDLASSKVVILGAGNVATHLCGALSHKCEVVQVWSRNIEHARELTATLSTDADCKQFVTQPISDLQNVYANADFYLVAVPDNAIADVAAQLPAVNGIVAHTSGSVNMQVLADCKCAGYGVFYPLQTFSRSKAVDFKEIPFFIEGSDETTTDSLIDFAKTLSTSVQTANSAQRASLHIAAVFACNFANHLWSIAADILGDANYDFSTLRPLLQETLNKACEMTPKAAQTGPAKRGDCNVISAHLAKLTGKEKELYELITNMIISKQHE